MHIVNAGAPSKVARNRTNLPAAITRRTDVDVVYALDNFSTEPRLVHWNSMQEISYDFRNSLIQEETENLRQQLGDSMLNRWTANLAASQVVAATGAASTTYNLAGATARKAFRKEDLQTAALRMDQQNVPLTNRVCVLWPDQYATLVNDTTLANNFTKYTDLAKNTIFELYGFKLLKRSWVVGVGSDNVTSKFYWDGDGNAVAPAATDNRAAICYHTASVAKALGTVKMFYQADSPQNYGDIYSFQNRIGGRERRADHKGMVIISEAP